jgi:hypothetical protein
VTYEHAQSKTIHDDEDVDVGIDGKLRVHVLLIADETALILSLLDGFLRPLLLPLVIDDCFACYETSLVA